MYMTIYMYVTIYIDYYIYIYITIRYILCQQSRRNLLRGRSAGKPPRAVARTGPLHPGPSGPSGALGLKPRRGGRDLFRPLL